MSAVLIRALLPADEAAWRTLWRGYCESDGATLPEAVTRRTWKRILDPDAGVLCIVAEAGGAVVGFAHCVVHEATREAQPVCHLEDLYVAPPARGRGVGSALFAWLRNAMPAEGWSRLYWLAAGDAAARRLFDRHAGAEGCVRYVIRNGA